LAWVPFFLLYVLFTVIHYETSLGHALEFSTRVVGSAALLAVGVWWLTGKYSWPARLRLSFYGVHLGVGSLYAIGWMALAAAGSAVLYGPGEFMAWFRSPILGWQFVMGLWLYGMVAGVCYAVRIRDRLFREERAAAHAEALATRARLAALRAQLNPHFLFNSLHSLSTLVAHDTAAAEQAIERLGDLLRYSLDEASADDVRLVDEWEFTRNYLALEQLRLNEPLQVDANLDEEALDCWVPSFTLQPLVENAVRHGIVPRGGGGTVAISATTDGSTLVIRVQDDGQGASLQEVFRANGLGLVALQRRLESRYAGEAKLSVDTAPGAGFAVTIRVPVEIRPRLPASS
jgi:signal transduction histidine kinase